MVKRTALKYNLVIFVRSKESFKGIWFFLITPEVLYYTLVYSVV